MEAFDLSGGGGRARRCQAMGDAVLSTDLVKEHLGLVTPKTVGEDLAVEFLSDVKSQFGLF
jgi:hypothetical protein